MEGSFYQVALVVKNPPVNAGDVRDAGLIPGLGRSSGGGNGNPLQYSCLENPMDRGTCWVTVHRVKKSWTRLTVHACIYIDSFVISEGAESGHIDVMKP